MLQNIKYNFNNKNIFWEVTSIISLEYILYYIKKNNIKTNLKTFSFYKLKDTVYTQKLFEIIKSNNIKYQNNDAKLNNIDFISLIAPRKEKTNFNINSKKSNILLLKNIYKILPKLNLKGSLLVISRRIININIFNIFKYIGTFFKKKTLQFLFLNKKAIIYIYYNSFKGIDNTKLNILNNLIEEKKYINFTNNTELDIYLQRKL